MYVVNGPRPHKPVGLVEWFKVAGIICGGLIAAGTVLHFIGAVAQSKVNEPMIVALGNERTERIAGDAALHSENAIVLARLDEIRALIVSNRKRQDQRWTQGGEPRATQGH